MGKYEKNEFTLACGTELFSIGMGVLEDDLNTYNERCYVAQRIGGNADSVPFPKARYHAVTVHGDVIVMNWDGTAVGGYGGMLDLRVNGKTIEEHRQDKEQSRKDYTPPAVSTRRIMLRIEKIKAQIKSAEKTGVDIATIDVLRSRLDELKLLLMPED